jgi:hypothetical protein
MAIVEFKVRCRKVLAAGVAAAVADWGEIEAQWWRQAKEHVASLDLPATQRATHERWLQADLELMRGDGRLRGTRSAFVLPHLLAEMQRRRWLHRRWRDLPPGERSRRARPWGALDQAFDAQFWVYLAPEIGEQLVRACYWTSAPYVQRLRELSDASGDYRAGSQRGPGSGYVSAADRDKIAAKVVTPAAILRVAAKTAVEQHNQQPPAPVPFSAR